MARALPYFARALPARTTLAAVVGLVWAISFGAARDFVWSDLRHGLISLRGLAYTTRVLVWFGIVLFLAAIAVLLFNGRWREGSDLVALTSSLHNPGRGATIPRGLIPLTLFLLAIGWSFLLAGALHAGRWAKLGVLVLYLLMAAQWIHVTNPALALLSSSASLGGYLAALFAGWALLLAVPAFFWWRRHADARPAVEFSVLLLLVGATLLLAHARALAAWQVMGSPMLSALLEWNAQHLAFLVLPMFLLIGVDLALLTRQVGVWTAGIVEQRLSRRGPLVLLALVLAWRAWDVGQEAAARMAREGVLAEMLQYTRAASVPLLVLLVWWAVTRWGGAEEEAETGTEALAQWVRRHALLLILLFSAVQFASLGIMSVLAALPQTQGTMALVQGWTGRQSGFPLTTVWQSALDVAALGGAIWLARRGQRSLALYLGILGLLHLWSRALWPGNLLEALRWSGSGPEDLWWVAIFGGFALAWALRGQLTTTRAAGLLALVVMSWLLRQVDLLDDPYSPFFFTYSGIGFIAFGIGWDMLTAGSWANDSTPRLPRPSRVLLYVGYVLLAVAAVNWAVTSHDLYTVGRFTGEGAAVGFDNFGKPLVFAVFALSLAALAREGRQLREAVA